MGFINRILGFLDPSSPAKARVPPGKVAYFEGEGDFGFPVVGESHYQHNLGLICGGKTEDGVEYECEATLFLDDDNPVDPYAVRVEVAGLVVGHLSRAHAREYREALAEMGYPGISANCAAMIRGGWDRGPDDQGNFGIFLDLPWGDS